MIYIGKSSYDNVLQRRDCHIERFDLTEEEVDFYVFEIGDEADSYYSEHEVLAKVAVSVPKCKILNESPGGYGGKSTDSEVPKFVNYLLVAKNCTQNLGEDHEWIDFSSWNSPFDMKEAAARCAFISADLSQFDLPKIKHHLTHRLLAKLLGYETLKDLQMKGKETKKVVCWQCGEKFPRVYAFNRHFESMHNGPMARYHQKPSFDCDNVYKLISDIVQNSEAAEDEDRNFIYQNIELCNKIS